MINEYYLGTYYFGMKISQIMLRPYYLTQLKSFYHGITRCIIHSTDLLRFQFYVKKSLQVTVTIENIQKKKPTHYYNNEKNIM